jgi:hypothetical protein
MTVPVHCACYLFPAHFVSPDPTPDCPTLPPQNMTQEDSQLHALTNRQMDVLDVLGRPGVLRPMPTSSSVPGGSSLVNAAAFRPPSAGSLHLGRPPQPVLQLGGGAAPHIWGRGPQLPTSLPKQQGTHPDDEIMAGVLGAGTIARARELVAREQTTLGRLPTEEGKVQSGSGSGLAGLSHPGPQNLSGLPLSLLQEQQQQQASYQSLLAQLRPSDSTAINPRDLIGFANITQLLTRAPAGLGGTPLPVALLHSGAGEPQGQA